ncbi:MAG TPA: hypothetical protein VFL91_16560 [Thermomicrobiales bacterium]|nr:hypothetical protein [Thermomicrobiales bacterium]
MSVKEELHALVDRLGDERAPEALAYLRRLLDEHTPAEGTAMARLAARMGPRVVAGRDFFTQPPADLETLAAQQGVGPVTDFDALFGDFWPEDESVDDFIAAVREWRREDDDA